MGRSRQKYYFIILAATVSIGVGGVLQSKVDAVSGEAKIVQLSAPIVTNVEQVTALTGDTGAIVQQLAAAQTSKPIAPVSYTSQQISSKLRDELFAVAAVTTILGAAIYAMTFTNISPKSATMQTSRRPLFVKQ